MSGQATDYEGGDEYEFDPDGPCGWCGGEGWFFGEDLPTYDFFWHDPAKVYDCPSCCGSGRREDMTLW